MTNKVLSIPTPAEAFNAAGMPHIDFADGYSGQAERVYASAEQAARVVFANPPRAVNMLMTLRNKIMHPFGIKAGVDFRDLGLGKIDVFPIISRTENEIVVGGDDKHLNFRIWISIQAGPNGSKVSMSTLVKINNLFGRIYLFTIMPFHKLLSRTMLRRALNKSDNNSPNTR
ncbi:DUF2867 domain-containing protein [Undibacterium sp. Dicai25W]|uniref:DUF2867 domain-containing protein n=1 Tax=Undibacterium sp. Dicai25W TaxID=3413034 RepID=UPI003BEF6690